MADQPDKIRKNEGPHRQKAGKERPTNAGKVAQEPRGQQRGLCA